MQAKHALIAASNQLRCTLSVCRDFGALARPGS
jgi:hypothetical protein